MKRNARDRCVATSVQCEGLVCCRRKAPNQEVTGDALRLRFTGGGNGQFKGHRMGKLARLRVTGARIKGHSGDMKAAMHSKHSAGSTLEKLLPALPN